MYVYRNRGKLTHLARPANLSNASYSSICEDVITASNSHKVDAVQSIFRPVTTVGEIYDTYQTTLEENGEKDSVLNVCGYTMGAASPPTWMEQPLIHKGNPVVLEKKSMPFFTHMILNDHKTGLSMAVVEQAIITEDAPEIITHFARAPIIKS